MPVSVKRKPHAPTISGAEVFILSILVLAGTGGAFFAQQHLAALRAEAALRPLDDNLAAGSSGPGEGSAFEPTATAEPVATGSDPSIPAVAVENPRASEISSAPIRTQSLLAIGDLISKRVLLPSAPPAQIAVVAARGGGAVVPAYMVGADGQLSPGFGQLFGISDADVATLQAASISIKQQADSVIAANTSVTETGPDAYSIDVRPAAEGQALRSEFESAFRAVLGDDGFRAFALLNGERDTPPGRVGSPVPQQLTGIAGLLGGFGADAKTITVSKVAGTGGPGPAGQLHYTFTIRSGTASGGGSGPMALQNLDARVGFPVSKLLPPGF